MLILGFGALRHLIHTSARVLAYNQPKKEDF